MVNTQMEISGGTEPPLSETPWHLALLGWRFSCTSLTDLPCSRTHQSGRDSSRQERQGGRRHSQGWGSEETWMSGKLWQICLSWLHCRSWVTLSKSLCLLVWAVVREKSERSSTGKESVCVVLVRCNCSAQVTPYSEGEKGKCLA